MHDCVRIRDLIESVLAGYDAPAALRKALKEHLKGCSRCRRYEFTRRLALERRASAPLLPFSPPAPRESGLDARVLVARLRAHQSLSALELARLCQACGRIDDPELRAVILASIDAGAARDIAYCQDIGPLVRANRTLSQPEERPLAAHLHTCPACWALLSLERLHEGIAPLRAESPGSLERDVRAFDELAFFLTADDFAAGVLLRHRAHTLDGTDTNDPCARTRALIGLRDGGTMLAPVDQARLHEHLRDCAACRAHAEDRGNARTTAGAASAEGLPTDDVSIAALRDALLPHLLQRITRAPPLSPAELDRLCGLCALLPTPHERTQAARALANAKLERASYCEGIERFLAWSEQGELSEAEEAFLRSHLKTCATCWPLWQRNVFLDDALSEVPPEPAIRPGANRSECADMQAILVALFEGHGVSAAQSSLLCRHLDECADCRLLEGEYRTLLTDTAPELAADVSDARARLATSMVRLRADIGASRPLEAREHAWLDLTGEVTASSVRRVVQMKSGRLPVVLRRVAAIVVLAVVVGLVVKSLGKDPVALLIARVEAAGTEDACLAARELGAYREVRVVKALESRMLADTPPELVGECLLSLTRIGTKEALAVVMRWEKLKAGEQRNIFSEFWKKYRGPDREEILKALLERASPRMLRFFMSDSVRSCREMRVSQFLRQVVETRPELEVQIGALREMQEHRMTAGLNLGDLLDSPNGALPEYSREVIAIAHMSGDYSITDCVADHLLELPPDWDEETMPLVTACRLYLFEAPDINHMLPRLRQAFLETSGRLKACAATVLAENGDSDALDWIFSRYPNAERMERWWLLGALYRMSNPGVLPRLLALRDNPPPATRFHADELAALTAVVDAVEARLKESPPDR